MVWGECSLESEDWIGSETCDASAADRWRWNVISQDTQTQYSKLVETTHITSTICHSVFPPLTLSYSVKSENIKSIYYSYTTKHLLKRFKKRDTCFMVFTFDDSFGQDFCHLSPANIFLYLKIIVCVCGSIKSEDTYWHVLYQAAHGLIKLLILLNSPNVWEKPRF